VTEKHVQQAEIKRQIRIKELFEEAWKDQIPKQFSPMTGTKSRLIPRTVLLASSNSKWISESNPELEDFSEYHLPRTCTMTVAPAIEAFSSQKPRYTTPLSEIIDGYPTPTSISSNHTPSESEYPSPCLKKRSNRPKKKKQSRKSLNKSYEYSFPKVELIQSYLRYLRRT
jgi:hypothetical protein